MIYEIKKGNVKISADTFGAELHSVQLNGLEYLWQCGDAWKRYAPILFPFVCSPKDRTYTAKGKTYKMKANHGFARDLEFKFDSQTDDSMSFVLCDSEETLAQYPYNFKLTVKYTALEDGVKIENIVNNTGSDDMYFYLGGHPAFNCPLTADETFDDYYVEYEKNEHITQNIGGETKVLVEDGNVIDISRKLFDNDAIILGEPKSKAISLKSKKSDHSVTVEYPQSECIAVWSPTADNRASFVCLEPWTSVPTDFDNDYENLEEKPHAVKLEAGKEFTYSYTIRVK